MNGPSKCPAQISSKQFFGLQLSFGCLNSIHLNCFLEIQAGHLEGQFISNQTSKTGEEDSAKFLWPSQNNLNFFITLSRLRSAIKVSIIFPPFSLSNILRRGRYLSTIRNPESFGHMTVLRVIKLAISPMYFLGSTAGQLIFFKLLANKQVS